MAYVQESTANPLGWRPWQSRFSGLGFYRRASFPLPTTGLSGLGITQFSTRADFAGARDWVAREGAYFDAPRPRVYRPPELAASRTGNPSPPSNWLFQPPGPPPRALGEMVQMWRTDPQSGLQVTEDINLLPRGVWTQSVFQPPAPPAVTPLGQAVQASGDVTVQLPGGQVVSVKSSPPPVGSDWGQTISNWAEQELIAGVKNKWLALGAAALLVLKRR